MTADAKRKVQLLLAVAIVAAALRTGWILYNRHAGNKTQPPQNQPAPLLTPDYYVIPKKLYPYDLKSARLLTRQSVWVKEGYRYTYYPFHSVSRHSDFTHEAGQLLPLQKLEIKDVVLDASPGMKGQRQVMAIFSQGGKHMRFRSVSRSAATTESMPTRSCTSRIPKNSTSTGRRMSGVPLKSTRSSPA